MALVSVLTLFLLRSLVASQKIWSLTDGVSRIYENSRVTFDLLENDLTAMTTSTVAGAEIGCYIGTQSPTTADDSLLFCVVSSTEPDNESASRLCEISYRFHRDEGSQSAIKPYTLVRQLITEVDTENWDFLNRPDEWYLNNNEPSAYNDFETVIRGVDSVEVRFYDSEDNQMSGNRSTTTRPNKVVLDLILFDETMIGAPEAKRHQTRRAFTKVFYLNPIMSPSSN